MARKQSMDGERSEGTKKMGGDKGGSGATFGTPSKMSDVARVAGGSVDSSGGNAELMKGSKKDKGY